MSPLIERAYREGLWKGPIDMAYTGGQYRGPIERACRELEKAEKAREVEKVIRFTALLMSLILNIIGYVCNCTPPLPSAICQAQAGKARHEVLEGSRMFKKSPKGLKPFEGL